MSSTSRRRQDRLAGVHRRHLGETVDLVIAWHHRCAIDLKIVRDAQPQLRDRNRRPTPADDGPDVAGKTDRGIGYGVTQHAVRVIARDDERAPPRWIAAVRGERRWNSVAHDFERGRPRRRHHRAYAAASPPRRSRFARPSCRVVSGERPRYLASRVREHLRRCLSGRSRTRLPVAANTAFSTAGVTTQIVGSPTPPQKSNDGTSTVSTLGISARRSTGYLSKFVSTTRPLSTVISP